MHEEFKLFLINISQSGFLMVKSIIFPFFLVRASFITLKEQSLQTLKRLIFLVILFFLLYYTSEILIGFILDIANELGNAGIDTLTNIATNELKTDGGITVFSAEILKRAVSALISFIYIFLNIVSYMLVTLIAIILPIGLALEICIGAGGSLMSAVSSFGTVFLYIAFFSNVLDKIRTNGFSRLSEGGEVTLYSLLSELVIVIIFIATTLYFIVKNREVSNFVNKPLVKMKDLAQESVSGVRRASSRSYANLNDKYKINRNLNDNFGSKIRTTKAYNNVLKPISKGTKNSIKQIGNIKESVQKKVEDSVNLFKEVPDFEFKNKSKNLEPIHQAYKKEYIPDRKDQIYNFKLSENKSVEIKGNKKAEKFNQHIQKNQFRKALENVDNMVVKKAETATIDKKSIEQQFKTQKETYNRQRNIQELKRKSTILNVAKSISANIKNNSNSNIKLSKKQSEIKKHKGSNA